MNLVMPLGVLAHQLVKIEGDLRFLSMKAAEQSGDDPTRPTRAVNARLEVIHESLDSIRAQLLRLQADLQPKRAAPSSMMPVSAETPLHKPRPEQDD